MALVNLKDVKVVSVFSKGIRVVEESKGRDGKDYSQRWTIWSTDLGAAEGDIISVSGFLAAKVNEWEKEGEKRHSVDLSLNSPRLSGDSSTAGHQSPSAAVSEPTGGDVWNTPTGGYNDETPF